MYNNSEGWDLIYDTCPNRHEFHDGLDGIQMVSFQSVVDPENSTWGHYKAKLRKI